jgi:hypothetical protein
VSCGPQNCEGSCAGASKPDVTCGSACSCTPC